MAMFITVLAVIGIIYSSLVLNQVGEHAVQAIETEYRDKTIHSLKASRQAYFAWKFKHKDEVMVGESLQQVQPEPVSLTQLQEGMFALQTPRGLGITFHPKNTETGVPAYICLSGTLNKAYEYESMKKGAYSLGAALSHSIECGQLIASPEHLRFPLNVSVSYYLTE